MAIAIPIIAAYGAGTAIAAGVATMATYATFAGAVLSTFGALSGEKSFTKLGAVLSIGGALAGGLNGMAGADGAKSAADATSAVDAADDAASLGGASDPGALAGVAGGTPGSGGAEAAAGGAADPGAMAGVAGGTPGTGAGVAEQFSTPPVVAGPQSAGNPVLAQPGAAAPLSAVEKAGAGIDSNSFNSWFEKAMEKTGKALGSTTEFVQKNPEMAKLGFGAINGMYGPEAQRTSLMKEEMARERSLMDRARENLNNPIRIKYQGG